ncbi:MAG: hypothetical protein WCJ45_05770 [bacterium]
MENQIFKFTRPANKITSRQCNLIKAMLEKIYINKPQTYNQLVAKLPTMNVLAGHYAIRRLMSLQKVATL